MRDIQTLAPLLKFLDDGAEKDPAFLRMMRDLKIPYTAFLSDYLVKEDYGYFKRMQKSGVVLNNHTLNHRYLPGLSYEGQRREICGMQDTIQKRYGKRPELFRPPYGNYNRDTLRAAKSCGVKAVPLWASEGFARHMEWREWDKDLHPGDIILTHFRGREDWKGTMPDMVRTVLKTVTAKGYAVARLEDCRALTKPSMTSQPQTTTTPITATGIAHARREETADWHCVT